MFEVIIYILCCYIIQNCVPNTKYTSGTNRTKKNYLLFYNIVNHYQNKSIINQKDSANFLFEAWIEILQH